MATSEREAAELYEQYKESCLARGRDTDLGERSGRERFEVRMVPSKWVRCCQGSTCTKRVKPGERFVGNRDVAGGSCIAVACSRNAPASYYLVQLFRQDVHASSARSISSQQSHPLLQSHHNTITVAPSPPPFHPNLAPGAAMLAGKAGRDVGLRGHMPTFATSSLNLLEVSTIEAKT